jgi:L,D-transpeptidase ErfK/SrfK
VQNGVVARWRSQGRRSGLSLALGLAGLLAAAPAMAGSLPGPPSPSDLVGRLGTHVVVEGETLLDVARDQRFGYTELIIANPELDPWLPPPGSQVLLPGAHLLPEAPRRGIVVNLADQRLYFYAADGVRSMPIGIGDDGQLTPIGDTRIVRKRKDPTWVPTASIRAEKPWLPAAVKPGPDNPLGPYALDLGWASYRIHGNNNPYSIGRRLTHGCIRLYDDEIAWLFDAVEVGTPVRVVDQPVKAGWWGGRLYLEVHPTQRQARELEEGREPPAEPPGDLVERIVAANERAGRPVTVDWQLVRQVALERRGVPVAISR